MKREFLVVSLLLASSSVVSAAESSCLKDWKDPLELTLHTNSKGLQSIALDSAPGGKRVYTDDDGLLTLATILSARESLSANIKAEIKSRWSEARERLITELDQYAKSMDEGPLSATASPNPKDPKPSELATKARSAREIARLLTPQWSDEAAKANSDRLASIVRMTSEFMGYCSFSVDENYESPKATKFPDLTEGSHLSAIEDSKLSSLLSFPPTALLLMAEKGACRPNRATLRIDARPARGPQPAEGAKNVK